MRIPADALIASEKFTSYLLVSQTRSDKSRYLAPAGYALENVGRLIDDLRCQILPLDATLSRSPPGELTDPTRSPTTTLPHSTISPAWAFRFST